MTTIHKMPSFPAPQRGVSTLVITLLLLVILSLVVLFSTSVGFFEQRTATNENRARIAEQAAETGISMAGEYIKANRALLISNQADVVGTTDGWLAATAGEPGWVTCNGISNSATLGGRPHPCRSEADTTRRNQLWFYTTNGTGSTLASTFMPYGAVGNVGGTAAFPSTVNVQAVLCRVDSSLSTPICIKNPSIGNRVAITFISHATLNDENSQAVIKETWSSYTDGNPSSAVPLIGSGLVKGLGNAQIVTSPNAGGYGVPASIWSPNDVGIGSGAGGVCPGGNGVGSVSTCQLGEYLKDTPEAELKTTCITSNNTCGCPAITSSENNFLSGHSNATKREGLDVLDVDSNDGTLPDVTYFPGVNCAGTNFSDIGDNTDDSLFEFIFGASNVVNEGSKITNNNCTGSSTNCASAFLIDELSAQVVTCAALNALGANASGLYYIQSTCDLGSQIGSPTSPAIVVLEGEAKFNGTDFFGMLFLRSNNQTAQFKGVGNSHIIGSLVVEGEIDIAGTIDIIYDNTAVSTDPNKFPTNAKFARVPGSWLDATEGF
jgi:hypothetical protein